MSDLKLTQTRFLDGIWEGQLTGAAPQAPKLEVVHDGTILATPEVSAVHGQAGHYAVRFVVPVTVLSEGAHTLLIREAGHTGRLAHVSILAGAALADDLRAELDLLRAELDLLKSAFRRHCVETVT